MRNDIPHLVIPPGRRDHIRGAEYAPVMLVGYGDYECPCSGAAFPVVDLVRQELGGLLGFAFRNFPMSTAHPHAKAAAEAAEAAGAQGRFWPMHDLLFRNQDALEYEDLVEYAEQLGLDVHRFSHELVNRIHAPRVLEDILGGARSGVHRAPTFFINGLRHDGTADAPSLLGAIRQVLGAQV